MGDKSYLANLTNSYLDQLLFSEWRGADLLIFCLLKEGVKDIFGVNGGAVLEIYHRLPRTPIKIWDMAHEQGAVHAAEGYNAVTGRPGVVLVTSGPGFTNTLTGITDAYMDSRGVVVISGQVPREMIGKMAFQEAPVT
ncbi:MAG: thiamine pyrophosphate-binding protein, partial [Candidatus Aenigmatarchaeota archaeon]